MVKFKNLFRRGKTVPPNQDNKLQYQLHWRPPLTNIDLIVSHTKHMRSHSGDQEHHKYQYG